MVRPKRMQKFMRNTLLFVILISVLFQNAAFADTPGINSDIRIFRIHAERIVRERFDELYPGVPEAEKRNILMMVNERFDQNTPAYSEYSIELSYKGEEGMSVFVYIDRTTGKIFYHTPWDFGALINDYINSIGRDEVYDIAMPLYKKALQEAIAKYPQKAKDFLDKYGSDTLDPSKMILEMLFVSPFGIGANDEPSSWQVFFGHQLEANPLTNVLYGNRWYYVEIDAKTGEIIRANEENEFFSVDFRLDSN